MKKSEREREDRMHVVLSVSLVTSGFVHTG